MNGIYESPEELLREIKSYEKIYVIQVKCIGCMCTVIHNPDWVAWKAENGILIIKEGKDKNAKFPIKMIEEISIKYSDWTVYKATRKWRVSGLYTRSLLSDDALQCLREFGL